jgi:hypothetical protein
LLFLLGNGGVRKKSLKIESNLDGFKSHVLVTDLILGFFLHASFQVYLEEELIFSVWGLDGVWYCM